MYKISFIRSLNKYQIFSEGAKYPVSVYLSLVSEIAPGEIVSNIKRTGSGSGETQSITVNCKMYHLTFSVFYSH